MNKSKNIPANLSTEFKRRQQGASVSQLRDAFIKLGVLSRKSKKEIAATKNPSKKEMK